MILREPRPTSPSTHAPHRGAFYDAAAAARLAAGAERAWCEPRRRFDRTRGGRRSYVARTQPRWGRLPVRGRTGGATGAARSGLRPVPAHRPGAAAVPQREPGGKRPRCLQAVGGADRPLQGGPFGAWGGPRRGPLRGVRPPVCSGSLIPEVKNNDSAIAKPFPVPLSCHPFGSRTGSSLLILKRERNRGPEERGRFGSVQPTFCSRASVGNEGEWP